MNYLDWTVLGILMLFIVVYGSYRSQKSRGLSDYFRAGNRLRWFTIGLSVMATQASAITFISTPGLAFEGGMSFVQNYFGLPLAMIVIAAFFLPVYYRLNVYTAYEYLEHRFDVRLRLFTAALFLLQRGLAAGITIYAPAIILSMTLDWDLTYTIIAVGLLVTAYTAAGGSKAVSSTQEWQMAIMMGGMLLVFIFLIIHLTVDYSLNDVLKVAGKMGKMNMVSFSTDASERYTIWSGLAGGFILALSYFGTDQSQVQRYLGGRAVSEGKAGLIFNAVFKIPMQFLILLTGVLVFVFFEFNPQPLLFNQEALNELRRSPASETVKQLELENRKDQVEKNALYRNYMENKDVAVLQDISRQNERIRLRRAELEEIRKETVSEKKAVESDYVMLYFILYHLPHGIIGLFICAVLSAAMSSTSGEINALAATSVIDFGQRLSAKKYTDGKIVLMSKLCTVAWGFFAIAFALFADMIENLIEAVNILGSLFYGTILGIFVSGLFTKKLGAGHVLWAALSAQGLVIVLFLFYRNEVGYLWYNFISFGILILLAAILRFFAPLK